MAKSKIKKVFGWVPGRGNGGPNGSDSNPVRKTTRIPVQIAITISGKDQLGHTFKETTRTIDVAKHGAKIATMQHLSVESEVTIANSAVGRTCLARLAWRGRRSSLREPVEIGVELLETSAPETIWGVKSPPDDWGRRSPAPTASQTLQYICASDRSRPDDLALEPEVADVPPPTIHGNTLAGADTAVSGVSATLGAEDSAATGIVEPAPESLKTGAQRPTESPRPRTPQTLTAEDPDKLADAIIPLIRPRIEKSLEASAAQLAQSIQDQALVLCRNADDAVNSIQTVAQKIVTNLQATQKEVEASFGSHAGDYREQLEQLAAGSLEGLERKSVALLEGFQGQLSSAFQGFQEKGAAELADHLERVAADFEERSSKHLEQRAEGTAQKLNEDLSASGAGLVEEARKQLAIMARASLESLTGEARAAVEQCRSQLTRALEEQTLAASGNLERNSATLLESFEGRLENTLQEFRRTGAKEVADQFHKIAADIEAQSTSQLQQQADVTLNKLSEELRASGTGLVDEAKDRLVRLTQASLEAVGQEVHATVSGSAEAASSSVRLAAEKAAVELDAARRKMEAGFEASAGDHERRLAAQAATSLAGLEHKSGALLDGFQGQLEGTLKAFQLKGAKEVAEQLQRIAAGLEASSSSQLQQQADATVKKLSEQLRTSGAELVDEARNQLASLTRASLESLSHEARAAVSGSAEAASSSVQLAAEKAGAELQSTWQKMEDSFKSSAADRQSQLANLASVSLEKLEQRSDALFNGFEDYRSQLLQAVQAQSATVSENADEAVNSVRRAAGEAVTALQLTRAEMEAGFEADAAEYQKRLMELASSGLEGLERKSGVLLEGFQGQLEGTVKGMQQKGVTEAADQIHKIAADLEAHSTRQLQLQGEATIHKVSEELRASGAGVVERAKQEASSVIQASLGSLTRAAGEESRRQVAQALEQQAATISGNTDAAVTSIRLAAEEATTRWQEMHGQTEVRFEASAREYHQQLTELATSGIENLKHQSGALLEGFQGQLESTLKGMQQKGATEAADQLHKIAADLEAHSARQLQLKGDATIHRVSEELRASGAGVVDRAKQEASSVIQASLGSLTRAAAEESHRQVAQALEQQTATISGNTDTAVTSIRLAAEEATTRWQAMHGHTEARFEASAREYHQRLTELATSGIKNLESQSGAMLEGFQGQLESTIQGYRQKATTELAGVLQKIAADFEQQSAAQLRKQAVDAAESLKTELRSSGLGVVEEARQLAGITKQALDSLSQVAAEGCRQKLDEFAADSAAIQKQIEELSRMNLDKVHKAVAPVRPSSRRLIGLATAFGLAAIIPVLYAAHLSSQPAMRLRSDLPAQFADTGKDWNAKRNATEAQLARGYWISAQQDVQSKYQFGMTLPDDPPSDFKIDPGVIPSGQKIDPTARTRYWHKVREAWARPDAWEETPAWNSGWLTSALQETAGKVRSRVSLPW